MLTPCNCLIYRILYGNIKEKTVQYSSYMSAKVSIVLAILNSYRMVTKYTISWNLLAYGYAELLYHLTSAVLESWLNRFSARSVLASNKGTSKSVLKTMVARIQTRAICSAFNLHAWCMLRSGGTNFLHCCFLIAHT